MFWGRISIEPDFHCYNQMDWPVSHRNPPISFSEKHTAVFSSLWELNLGIYVKQALLS